MNLFGQRLRELREAAGFSQSAVADSVGISGTYVCALENGRKPAPPHAVVFAFASFFDVDPDGLWELACTERRERLLARLDGEPTSLRLRRAPARRAEVPPPGGPLTDVKPNAQLESAIQAIREALTNDEERAKFGHALSLLGEALTEDKEKRGR